MKVEYSFYLDSPSLIVKGADFMNALKDKDETYLLKTAINGFAVYFDVDSHFSEDVNAELLKWTSKTSEIIYTIKERWAGRTLLNSWCEVYVSNNGRPTPVIFSEDFGRNYEISRKGMAQHE